MAIQWCVNGTTLNQSNYSNPVPVIGLYVAAATLVCFLFMFCDIWIGLHHKKLWLPCGLFSLNSLTLTLLAVVAKLPVDLTTPMPSAQDQLSKLTGTTMICICMGFCMPSLGTMSSSECFSNMAALAIFVVTVIVNICIQMGTGLIFSFVVEHVIILFFMLLLLISLWFSTFEIIIEKDISLDRISDLLVKGKGSSMIDRLRLCYVYSYMSNPQLVICRTPYVATVGMLSTLCTLVLSEALLRSLVFEKVTFCRGESEYTWSTWMVVGSQIGTVIFGFGGNLFRWIALATHMDTESPSHLLMSEVDYLKLHGLINCNLFQVLVRIVTIPVLLGFSSINTLVALPSKRVVHAFLRVMECVGISLKQHRDRKAVKEFKKQFKARNIEAEKWILRKGVEDMNRWIKIKKRRSASNLVELLSKFPPSQESLPNYIERIHRTDGKEVPSDYKVSCLSMVILVRTAANLLPRKLSNSLARTLAEAFEIVYFIDKKMSSLSFENKRKLKFAKEMWKEWNFNNPFMYYAGRLLARGYSFKFYPLGFVRREVGIIIELINREAHSSDEDLYKNIQQLLVDMLHVFLIQLPNAIFKDVVDGPSEEDCEDRIKLGIRFLRKLELLEDKLQWVFPEETDITNLITSRVSADENDNTTQTEGSETGVHGQVIQEGSKDVSSTNEIQEVG